MSNRRLVLLIIAMLGLAGLLWLDREQSGDGTSDIAEPIDRRTVVATAERQSPEPSTAAQPVAQSSTPRPAPPPKSAQTEAVATQPPPAAKVERRRRSSDDDQSGAGSQNGAAPPSSEPPSSEEEGQPGAAGRRGQSAADADGDGNQAELQHETPPEASEEPPPVERAGERRKRMDRGVARRAAPPSGEAAPAATAPAEGERQTSLNPLASIAIDVLKDTVERPLFETSRRAYEPPPPPPREVSRPAQAPRAPPPDPTYFSLAGISAGPDRSIALLKPKSNGRFLRVEAGEVVDGWKIEKVAEQEVVISKQGLQVILRIVRKSQG